MYTMRQNSGGWMVQQERILQGMRRSHFKRKRKKENRPLYKTPSGIAILCFFVVAIIAYSAWLAGSSTSVDQPGNMVSNNVDIDTKVEQEGDFIAQSGEYIQDDSELDEMTMGQKNALSQAESYLQAMPFSRNGLVEQLEYEGYSHDDAVFAVSNCGADWSEQALLKAISYLDVMSFSQEGLVDQLLHEGFSEEQARYGVKNCGADWDEQAALKAQSYLEIMSFSRDGLIEQLEYEGFTRDQAEYGASAVGY